MRQIIKTTETTLYEMVVGEWEAYDVDTHTEIVDTCDTLEESLERLGWYKSQALPNETYHIGYEDVNLYLEEWEERWIELCSIIDKQDRLADLNARRLEFIPYMNPEDELWETEEYEEFNNEY